MARQSKPTGERAIWLFGIISGPPDIFILLIGIYPTDSTQSISKDYFHIEQDELFRKVASSPTVSGF